MSSRRALVLEVLRRRGWATAAELARSLGMTTANVRHHLDELQAASLVEVVAARPSGRRGRPVKVYALSSGVVGDNLENLTKALLEVLLEGAKEGEIQNRLNVLARQLVAQVEAAPAESSLSLRLGSAVERLNTFRYRARWEASAQGPRLILGRCPYRRLVESHPELCQMDAYLVSALTGYPAEQVAKQISLGGGLPICVFLVRV